jgi:hypothetical protein
MRIDIGGCFGWALEVSIFPASSTQISEGSVNAVRIKFEWETEEGIPKTPQPLSIQFRGQTRSGATVGSITVAIVLQYFRTRTARIESSRYKRPTTQVARLWLKAGLDCGKVRPGSQIRSDVNPMSTRRATLPSNFLQFLPNILVY